MPKTKINPDIYAVVLDTPEDGIRISNDTLIHYAQQQAQQIIIDARKFIFKPGDSCHYKLQNIGEPIREVIIKLLRSRGWEVIEHFSESLEWEYDKKYHKLNGMAIFALDPKPNKTIPKKEFTGITLKAPEKK